MSEPEWVAQVVTEYAAGRPLLLLFDYDGTLTPIAPHPDLAKLPPASRNTLAALAALDRVTVGVISGRSLEELRSCVGLPAVWYGGSGGMSLDIAAEVIHDNSLAVFERIADALVATLAGTVEKYPGAWVERKPGCLAVHYRALTPLDSTVLIEDLRDLLLGLAADHPPLRSRAVSRSVEIALAQAWTKGEAVAWMYAARDRDPFVVYAGDGTNDEEAVDWVNAHRGITIGVGEDAPWASQIRLPAPGDLAEELERLGAELTRLGNPDSAGSA